MIKAFRKLFYVCNAAGKRFFVDRYTYRASALSFTSLLALVPLISVIVFFTSISPLSTKLVALAQNYIFQNFIPTSSQTIQFYLESFVTKARSLPAIGMIFLVITVGLLITTIVHTLNEVWQAPPKRKRTVWLLYYFILLITPILIGLSLVLSSYLFSLSWLGHSSLKLKIELYFFTAFSFFINTIIFTALYTIVPNCRVHSRDGFVGGFIAALLFEAAKKIFSFYIVHFPSYELIYGVIATIPIFLVWIYISWVIILFGALVAHATSQLRGRK